MVEKNKKGRVNTAVNVLFDWSNSITSIVSLVITYVLALPIGWEREKGSRPAAVSLLPLMAMASCGFMIIAQQVAGESLEARASILKAVITGIGIIGGGAMLKEGTTARGTAVAASIWATGALGVAIGYGYYEIAIFLSLLTFLVVRFLTPVG